MAVNLNGTSQYLSRTTSLPSITNFTICGWAYATDITQYRHIIGIGSGYLRLLRFSGSVLYIYDGVADTAFGSSPSANVWFFWALKCDSTTLTGHWASVSGTTFTTITDTGLGSGSVTVMELGANSGSGEFFEGRLAYVRLWDAVLTEAELLQEMRSIHPRRFTNPNLWSPLMVNATDYSGAGRNWTETGSPTYVDGPPVSWGAPVMVVGAATGGVTGAHIASAASMNVPTATRTGGVAAPFRLRAA